MCKFRFVVAAIALSFSFSCFAQDDVTISVAAESSWINIDITEDGLSTMTGYAAIGKAGDIWNRYSSLPGKSDVSKIPDLLDVTGKPTGVSFSLSGATAATAIGLGRYPLFYGYHFVRFPQITTIQVTGLESGGRYALYIYSSAGLPNKIHDQGAVFTFGAIKIGTVVPDPIGASGYDKTENYVTFEVTADAEGSIIGTMEGKGPLQPIGVINGIQIVKILRKAAVPEEVKKTVFAPHLSGLWPSQAPSGCPFEPSTEFAGLSFTGKHSDYHVGDTWYPSWATDDQLYSPYTDGDCPRPDGQKDASWSAGERPTTGHAVLIGDDPIHLQLQSLGVQIGFADPYQGRYPCGSLVYNGVWYYGTYCLGTDGWVKHGDKTFNWPFLGPMPGFRISTDYGKTWTDTPHTPIRPLFPEPAGFLKPVKIGAPHFVDFGKNMEYSPDGKAYLVGHGAEVDDPEPRFGNLSWIAGDQIYICRVIPSPENINDESKYEYFAGHDTKNQPIWSYDFNEIKPLLDWNNHAGCVTITYNAPFKKYLMCVTDGWPSCAKMSSYILEANVITGPYKLITYMKDFGEQAYFLTFPSKFISADGRILWLCYSGNYAIGPTFNDLDIHEDPPGSHYGLVLQEVVLVTKDKK